MDSPPDMVRAVSRELVNTVPPVTVAALTLNEWVMVASLAYIALQASFLIWRWRSEWRYRNKRPSSDE